jgi:hypothetical protein
VSRATVNLFEPDPREGRLPAWAQRKLDSARHLVRVAQEQAEAARLATKPDETDTIVDRYADIPIGLPKGCRVRYRTGPHDLSDYFEIRADGNGVEVHAGGPMIVIPQVTNVLRLEARR